LRENVEEKDQNFGTTTTGSIMTTRLPKRPWKPESVTNNMVIVPHPPCLPDLAPCDFTFFPKLKKNWREDVLKQCLTSKGNRKWYSTALRKMTSTVLLKHGENCIRSQGDYFEGHGSQNRVS
jgi:hypothetical protein